MYIDNPTQSITADQLTIYDAKAPTSTGGIFMVKNAAAIQITNSLFQRFGPGSYGTFLYSTCTTLDLLIEDSVLMCYDNPYTYSTDL